MPRYRQIPNPDPDGDTATIFVEIGGRPKAGHFVIDDSVEMRSPKTGEMFTSRAKFEQHLKENDLTRTSDFTNQWEQQAKKREALTRGEFDDPQRKEDIQRAIYRLEHGYKDYADVNHDIPGLDR